MVTIQFRHSSGIQPHLRVGEEEGPFRFRQPAVYDKAEIAIEVSAAGDKIESVAEIEIPDNLASNLSRISKPHDLDHCEWKQLHSFFSILPAAHRRLLALILQEFREPEPHILTSGPSQWSLDGDHWFDFPGGGLLAGIRAHPLFKLDSEWREHIQTILDLHEEPLIASEHLHEAKRNRGDRFSWIEATVAAELAIKEALVKLEPTLEVLLLEVPSPPIHKLYGPILERIAREKSPYVTALQKGVDKRNRLVHRPKAAQFGPQEVVDYVGTVERAIWHLVKLCRRKAAEGKSPSFHPATELY